MNNEIIDLKKEYVEYLKTLENSNNLYDYKITQSFYDKLSDALNGVRREIAVKEITDFFINNNFVQFLNALSNTSVDSMNTQNIFFTLARIIDKPNDNSKVNLNDCNYNDLFDFLLKMDISSFEQNEKYIKLFEVIVKIIMKEIKENPNKNESDILYNDFLVFIKKNNDKNNKEIFQEYYHANVKAIRNNELVKFISDFMLNKFQYKKLHFYNIKQDGTRVFLIDEYKEYVNVFFDEYKKLQVVIDSFKKEDKKYFNKKLDILLQKVIYGFEYDDFFNMNDNVLMNKMLNHIDTCIYNDNYNEYQEKIRILSKNGFVKNDNFFYKVFDNINKLTLSDDTFEFKKIRKSSKDYSKLGYYYSLNLNFLNDDFFIHNDKNEELIYLLKSKLPDCEFKDKFDDNYAEFILNSVIKNINDLKKQKTYLDSYIVENKKTFYNVFKNYFDDEKFGYGEASINFLTKRIYYDIVKNYDDCKDNNLDMFYFLKFSFDKTNPLNIIKYNNDYRNFVEKLYINNDFEKASYDEGLNIYLNSIFYFGVKDLNKENVFNLNNNRKNKNSLSKNIINFYNKKIKTLKIKTLKLSNNTHDNNVKFFNEIKVNYLFNLIKNKNEIGLENLNKIFKEIFKNEDVFTLEKSIIDNMNLIILNNDKTVDLVLYESYLKEYRGIFMGGLNNVVKKERKIRI